MKKKICAMLLGLMIAGTAMSMGVSAASQGDITVTYTTPQSTVIDKGGQQVQTGDTSSSAWIYTLVIVASTLAMLAILLGKKRKEEEDEETVGN